jgi:hypothetical protein
VQKKENYTSKSFKENRNQDEPVYRPKVTMMMNPMISQARTQVDNLLLDVVVVELELS